MKNPDRNKVARLEDLPNVGKATAADLKSIGVEKPSDLPGKDPFVMYESLCALSGKRLDPCVADVLASAVAFMEGGKARPWWEFTADRKRSCGVRPKPCVKAGAAQ